MKVQIPALVLQILSLLPLVAYPAVLVANIMQTAALLDASQRDQNSRWQRALMGSFVGGTTAYPVVLLACRVLAGRAHGRGDATGELAWSAAPLAFLGALYALFVAAERAERAG